MSVQNPFRGQSVAARYASSRPPLHDHVAEQILARQPRVSRAIDLACGTGLSTTPLLKVADHVVGVDLSPEMIRLAPRSDHVSYAVAAAERAPFESQAFDLATVCSGIHWFAIDALMELHRIVREEGTLVIYDVWFPDEMVDEPRFSEWVSEVCVPRYPYLAKKHDNIDALSERGFSHAWDMDERYEVPLSLRTLVQYLMTHSQRIAAVHDGQETEVEQEAFLTDGLRPWFGQDDERLLIFGIWAKAFRRES